MKLKIFPLSLIIFVLLPTCFCGCSEKEDADTVSYDYVLLDLIETPSEISEIEDFKCVVSICDKDGWAEKEWVVEEEQAKEIYEYLYDLLGKAEKANRASYTGHPDFTYEGVITVNFQAGEPILHGVGRQPIDTTVHTSKDIQDSKTDLYAYFQIFKHNEYLFVTEKSIASYSEDYYLPDGTYKTVREMVEVK